MRLNRKSFLVGEGGVVLADGEELAEERLGVGGLLGLVGEGVLGLGLVGMAELVLPVLVVVEGAAAVAGLLGGAVAEGVVVHAGGLLGLEEVDLAGGDEGLLLRQGGLVPLEVKGPELAEVVELGLQLLLARHELALVVADVLLVGLELVPVAEQPLQLQDLLVGVLRLVDGFEALGLEDVLGEVGDEELAGHLVLLQRVALLLQVVALHAHLLQRAAALLEVLAGLVVAALQLLDDLARVLLLLHQLAHALLLLLQHRLDPRHPRLVVLVLLRNHLRQHLDPLLDLPVRLLDALHLPQHLLHALPVLTTQVVDLSQLLHHPLVLPDLPFVDLVHLVQLLLLVAQQVHLLRDVLHLLLLPLHHLLQPRLLLLSALELVLQRRYRPLLLVEHLLLIIQHALDLVQLTLQLVVLFLQLRILHTLCFDLLSKLILHTYLLLYLLQLFLLNLLQTHQDLLDLYLLLPVLIQQTLILLLQPSHLHSHLFLILLQFLVQLHRLQILVFEEVVFFLQGREHRFDLIDIILVIHSLRSILQQLTCQLIHRAILLFQLRNLDLGLLIRALKMSMMIINELLYFCFSNVFQLF